MEIRAKEASLQVVVNGNLQGGSFLKITNFDVSETSDIASTQFVGEPREDNDLDIKGHEFSFETHEERRDWFDLKNQINQAEHDGDALPDIQLIVTKKYRGNQSPLVVTMYGSLVLKFDGNSNSGADYTTVRWTGRCKYAEAV